MGLTIHYKLKSNTKTTDEARELVEALRECALKLPFKEVGDIVESKDDECDFNRAIKDDEYRWLKIQSQQYIDGGSHSFAGVIPSHIIAFSAWPGEGSEPANFGLCLYPKKIEIKGESVSTRLGTNFLWGSFCKTQYASDPECGGVGNFLKCHLAVISLLDHAKFLGILKSVSEISGHSDFERLEASFERKNPEETDNMRRTARVIATLVGGIADDRKNET